VNGPSLSYSDVWGFGIFLCILLSGTPPLENAKASDACFVIIRDHGIAHLFEQWGLVDKLGVEGIALVGRCLKVDPVERPTMEELVQDPFFAGTLPFSVMGAIEVQAV
jgi:serine/threonine protein kinase